MKTNLFLWRKMDSGGKRYFVFGENGTAHNYCGHEFQYTYTLSYMLDIPN